MKIQEDIVEFRRAFPMRGMAGIADDVYAVVPQRAITQRAQVIEPDERLARAVNHAQRLVEGLDGSALVAPDPGERAGKQMMAGVAVGPPDAREQLRA